MAALHASGSATNLPASFLASCAPEDGSLMLRSKRICFQSAFEASDNTCEEAEGSEGFVRQPEKKKRLTVEQVKSLERNFEMENKLEPDRKIQIANELGLQPRQVAIWFQNRRARWKTKRLEKDYDALETDYLSLKEKYDALLKEKDNLETEMASLRERLQLADSQEEGRGEDSEANFTGISSLDIQQEGKESQQAKQRADAATEDLPVPTPLEKEASSISDMDASEISHTSSPRCLESKVSIISRDAGAKCFLISNLKSNPQATSAIPSLFSESLLKKVQAVATKIEPENMHHETACRSLLIETEQETSLDLWDWDYCNFYLNT